MSSSYVHQFEYRRFITRKIGDHNEGLLQFDMIYHPQEQIRAIVSENNTADRRVKMAPFGRINNSLLDIARNIRNSLQGEPEESRRRTT